MAYQHFSLLQLHATITCLIIICFAGTCSSEFSSAPSPDNNDDAATLLKVKEQLGNPMELSGWVPGTNPCFWRYIFCSSTGRVREIFFRSLNVSAPMPPALGGLSALETLSIDTMPGLYGPIPDSLGNLSHLQIFNIMVTSVTGPIPESLSRTNISSMALFNNRIIGTIPESLSQLPFLNFLDLSNNSLTGYIPTGLVKGSPTTPAWLILHHNNLIGKLSSYYGGRYFDTVNVGHNHLQGDSSFLFGRNKRFTNINLSWNSFKFDLTNVKLPDTLRFLDLSHNRIRGRVPTSLINVRVAVLNLSDNQLCGEIPTGGFMSWHHADAYANNKCLCGTPLPLCSNHTKAPSPPPVPY